MLYNIANLADYIVHRSLDQNKPLTSLKLYYISILLYLWNFKKFEWTHLRFGCKFLRSPDIEEHYPYGLGALGIFSVPFCYPFDWKNFKTPVLDKGNDFYSEFDQDIDFMIDAFYNYSKDYYQITELSEKIRLSLYNSSYWEDRNIPYDVIESEDTIQETVNEYREIRDKHNGNKLHENNGGSMSLNEFAKKFKLEYHGVESSKSSCLGYHCFTTSCEVDIDYVYDGKTFVSKQKTATMIIWIDKNKEFKDRLSPKRVYIEFSNENVPVNLNHLDILRYSVEETKSKVRKKVKTFIEAWNTISMESK